MKKYNFCVDKEAERSNWLNALNKASRYKTGQRAIGGDSDSPASTSTNPLHSDDGPEITSFRPSTANVPAVKQGKLKKKSPALLTGWQKRYFVLRAPGELAYFDKVCNAKPSLHNYY